MSEASDTSRKMLRSTSIVATASAINIVLGIVRLKVFALLLGPAGVGLSGLLSNLMLLAANLAGLGTGSSGLRQVASSEGDEERRRHVLQVMWLSALCLGFSGGVLVFLLRAPLARWVVGDVDYAYGVGWLGIGVAASVIGAVFTAMLQGLLRIGDFAKVVIIGNIVGTAAAIAVVWRYGVEHIYFAVICLPVSIALVGAFFVRGLVSFGGVQAPRHLAREFSALIRFGGVMLFVTMLSMSVVMAARALIAQRLGFEAAGQFHAAWLLSSTYIGFLLTSMTADYYPRLTATIANGGDAAGLINEQIHLGVALISPVIVAVIGFAPLIILVLYSAKFAPAADVLQVQVLGDLIRILSFPFAFALLSANATERFVIAEVAWSACYFLCLHFGIDHFGLMALAYAYLSSCVLYAALVGVFAHRTFHLCISPHVRRAVVVSVVLSLVTLAAAKWSVLLGYGVGGLAMLFLGFSALRLVLKISQIERNGFAERLARFLPDRMKAFLLRWINV